MYYNVLQISSGCLATPDAENPPFFLFWTLKFLPFWHQDKKNLLHNILKTNNDVSFF